MWRNANGEGELTREEPSNDPHYLIGDKGTKLFVRGTVSGLFTVYTPNDIEIEDDLVYAKDPRQTLSVARLSSALIAGRTSASARPRSRARAISTVHARDLRAPPLLHRTHSTAAAAATQRS